MLSLVFHCDCNLSIVMQVLMVVLVLLIYSIILVRNSQQVQQKVEELVNERVTTAVSEVSQVRNIALALLLAAVEMQF